MRFLSFLLPVKIPYLLGLLLVIPTVIVGEIILGVFPKNVQAQNSTPGGVITLSSDIQEANSETGVLTARGNVQIYYPAQQIQATATQAQYFSRERRLVLSGNVYVLQKGNSMRAETMTYLIDEGRFIATPTQKGQVESIYIIPDGNNAPQPITLPATPIINNQS
jgi:lipopolysaccharide export system protein LptA